MAVRRELVFLIYQRMRFTAADTAATAEILGFLLIGAVGFTGQTIVNRGFYARQNTILPTVYGSLAVLLSLPVYFVGMRALGASGIGIAIAFSAVAQVLFIYMIWNRQSGNRESTGVYGFYLKMLLMAVPLFGVLEACRHHLASGLDPQTIAGSLLVLIVVSGLGAALMLIAARLTGVAEVSTILEMVRERLRR